MLDFLGIGAQKAGTTWLYQRLAAHPQILFPAGKEVHFWDHKRERGVGWWLGLFERKETKEGGPEGRPPVARCGEITPAYSLLEQAEIELLAAHCPDLRLFASLRNPMDRAWSAALMALGRAEMTPSDASDAWFADHFRSAGSLARGDYAAWLERWWKIFGHEAVHLIFYEQILHDPRRVLTSLCQHLGVDPRPVQQMESRLLSAPVFPGPALPLRPSLRPLLLDLYRERIRALEALLERDLSGWLESAPPEAGTPEARP